MTEHLPVPHKCTEIFIYAFTFRLCFLHNVHSISMFNVSNENMRFTSHYTHRAKAPPIASISDARLGKAIFFESKHLPFPRSKTKSANLDLR